MVAWERSQDLSQRGSPRHRSRTHRRHHIRWAHGRRLDRRCCRSLDPLADEDARMAPSDPTDPGHVACDGQAACWDAAIDRDRSALLLLAAGLRPAGRGGSEEDVGFEAGSDGAVAADIRREWGSLFPSLRGLRFTSCWSGFRPFCEDMQPVIGRVPGCDGVYVSAGHFRKGILLAPLSGELLADQLLENRQWRSAKAFRPDRFPLAAQLCQ